LEGDEDIIIGDIKAKFVLVSLTPKSTPEKTSPGKKYVLMS
jgi:hypothetical protein